MSKEYAYYLPKQDEIRVSKLLWYGRKIVAPMQKEGTFNKPHGSYWIVSYDFVYLGVV